ncbi:A/G-specific adenine glycosylase [Deinococcus sp. KNUC1210]|uniref:A/G-specific adenine glycosylase n=1 Tax=Deinococcus sp. KNUC1210 TaxID=2917691 RepID=UPI001EF0C933|nr:A/G-specific adenine glycosylase [Deinococcus sp. KNUC1210]ULH14553.1 A/G-specific adenine glycosylase [Deinococcus sp. KNUC1210]
MDLPALHTALLGWFAVQRRDLPWRMTDEQGRRDPYRVWVSEVLLQQTQVVRGRVYFERFLTAFPTVEALALAPQEAVLKAWEGCGYYARARNLHRAAQQIVQSGLPTTYEGWRALPGVGPYTAAAIASLAFGEAQAVLDGNVRRVLSRLHAVEEPSPRWAQETADALLDAAHPGEWNEAVMDLGATLCTPANPRCAECPLSAQCAAFASGDPSQYPAPKKRAAVRQISAVALLIGTAQQAYLEQRAGALLGGLWGLPLEELKPDEDEAAALQRLTTRLGAAAGRRLGTAQHNMTHRTLAVTVYAAEADLPLTPVVLRPLPRLDQKLLALDSTGGVQPALF